MLPSFTAFEYMRKNCAIPTETGRHDLSTFDEYKAVEYASEAGIFVFSSKPSQ